MDRERQQELLQEIREKNDIVAVISEYVTLRRSGRSLLGLCPFHSEKTSSFNVNEEKQFYYCFGCSQGGDVFNFIMKKEGLEFIEAARRLADRAGILWPEEEAASAAGKEREEYLRINKLAAAFFNHCLLKTETGKPALDYLTERGITAATAERFGLGYAPAGWHTLTEIFRRKEVDLVKAERLGLIGSGENGYYDRFRDRVIFPISDAQGRIAGFGGRAFGSSGEPKYLNSPESPFFHKGHFWFGLNLAKEAIRKTGQAIIVEGYLDAIQAHQAGFSQTVASLGTALTREQARILARFAKDAVLAYDADAAGQDATLRGMEILQQAGLAVQILSLPLGDDPDSFIKRAGPAAFGDLLQNAPGLSDFKFQLALRAHDLNSPEGKAGAVEDLLPLLAAIENVVVREAYLRKLAREIGVSETSIAAQLRAWNRKSHSAKPVFPSGPPLVADETFPQDLLLPPPGLTALAQAIFNTERELLTSILQEYDIFERIKEKLNSTGFCFEPWRGLLMALSESAPTLQDLPEWLDQQAPASRDITASLLASAAIQGRKSNVEGWFNYLQMLKLQSAIEELNGEIISGRATDGRLLDEAEIKTKTMALMELQRRLRKEFPRFTAGTMQI